ncbi:flagellar biosynthetic protein FliO [Tepidanaerobacter sp. EBM-38]|uniref:FliO/MopB family protein n=1 Tax=Tepidanaerobacter sp. EBM-38 TaxID=1918496 RepID=UPI000A8970B9|nr:flagellar biosynthetic protein FliO [Tepidanaerobacter sp. EBM-38]
MRKYMICLSVLVVCCMFFTGIQIFAEPINIDNIKNYDIDPSDDVLHQNHSTIINIITFFIYLFFFIVISLLTYFTVRWIGKRQMKLTIKSKYMEVVDSLSLGGEKGLFIVKTPQGMLILGVTKESVDLLEKVGREEAELIRAAEANQESHDKVFTVYLNNYLNKLKGSSDKIGVVDQNEN